MKTKQKKVAVPDLTETTNIQDYRLKGGNPDSFENQRIAGDLVRREVYHCCSSMVSAMAKIACETKIDDVKSTSTGPSRTSWLAS